MIQYQKLVFSLLECNLDDMNPEFFPYVSERLFSSGARDVWLTPIIMKGGRPAACLSALCDTAIEEELASIIFSETTTLGLRVSKIERYELNRSLENIPTSAGEVPIKVARDITGKVINAKPEYSACKKAAQKSGLPLKDIYEQALAAWRSRR